MKWKEFEAKYPQELYEQVRALCEERHEEAVQKGGRGAGICKFCYKRQGWWCFPCTTIKERYRERYGGILDDAMSPRRKV
ncbi:MAG: hypothetical protein ACFFCO_09380 [Promethearchaeota archaeon]